MGINRDNINVVSAEAWANKNDRCPYGVFGCELLNISEDEMIEMLDDKN